MRERVLALGGIVAALAATTCCVVPVILTGFGVGGAWASTLAVLAPYRIGFRVAAILLLGAGFWTVYARNPVASDGIVCAPLPYERATRAALWTGLGLMVLVLSSGWWYRFVA
jgi:mercuric ion transport protein